MTYPKSKKGTLQVRLTRGARIAAMGHAKINGRRTSVTLRQIRHLTKGTWKATLVLRSAHQPAQTTTTGLRMS